MARERGSGKTPERVVEMLTAAVKDQSILAVHKATGIGLAAIGRYLKGIGEPTTATLQKLADYFGVSVAHLRGEEDDLIEVMVNRLMQHSGSKTLQDIVDDAKRRGIITTVASVQELLPKAEQELVEIKANDEEIYKEGIDALLAYTYFHEGSYDIKSVARTLEILLESEAISYIIEALIPLPEEKRKEVITILQREGIIPASTPTKPEKPGE